MASGTQNVGAVCSCCSKSLINGEDDENCNKTVDKCKQWLDKCNVDTDFSETFSCTDLDTVSNNSEDEGVVVGDKIITRNDENMLWDNITNKNSCYYKNIQVCNSENVHIGNVTHIHGPVYINKFAPTLHQNISINNNQKTFPLVPRRTWLAQPPLDPEDVKYFVEPPKFVIISHSASEAAYTQTDNNLLVRLIQQFHIESFKWNDIGYNFLAGAEGSIYEGRGWNTIGAHTLKYNSISIGICFIGCYSRVLPPAGVLKKVQTLIRYGVEIGAIAEDYTLLGHRQCRSSESPGSKLFEEIQTWDRWDGTISVLNPSPLIIE